MSVRPNDKENLLNAAKVVLVNRFILTKSMHRFYARETFRLFRKKWRNRVFAAGLITLAAGIVLTALLPGYYKVPGIVVILLGLYFLFMSYLPFLYHVLHPARRVLV